MSSALSLVSLQLAVCVYAVVLYVQVYSIYVATCCSALQHCIVQHSTAAVRRPSAVPRFPPGVATERAVLQRRASAQDAPAWLDRARSASGFAVSAEAHLAVVGINCTLLAPTVRMPKGSGQAGAVSYRRLSVPLLRLSVPLLFLAVPLLFVAVPLLRLSVPLLRLSVP